eukprot:NODE_2183_length_449_cov_402.332500_g2104_i0.p2 GENE.NODE_2183_length_449_cov_402.332500_g2104_i0~~NODE_2183_length_449_cov_402.332500_g2104_i0.p2  ORF type:complete len:100 (+),score=15.79 NODE_2183_length_449_cov_402.332500_g2104_i0:69-368(+)
MFRTVPPGITGPPRVTGAPHGTQHPGTCGPNSVHAVPVGCWDDPTNPTGSKCLWLPVAELNHYSKVLEDMSHADVNQDGCITPAEMDHYMSTYKTIFHH